VFYWRVIFGLDYHLDLKIDPFKPEKEKDK